MEPADGNGADAGGDEPGRAREHDLDELRREIEALDAEIVEAIARRTYVGESIAEAKQAAGRDIEDPDRERRVIARVRGLAEDLDVDPDAVEDVFHTLFELNKREQRDAVDEE